jgi:hypothetical protein
LIDGKMASIKRIQPTAASRPPLTRRRTSFLSVITKVEGYLIVM